MRGAIPSKYRGEEIFSTNFLKSLVPSQGVVGYKMDFEAVLTTFSLLENLTNFEKSVLVGYAGGLPCVVGGKKR